MTSWVTAGFSRSMSHRVMKCVCLAGSSKNLLDVALPNHEAVSGIISNAKSLYQTGSTLHLLYRSMNQGRLIVNVPPYVTHVAIICGLLPWLRWSAAIHSRRRPWTDYRGGSCETCGGESSNGAGFSPSASVFSHRCNCSNAPHSISHLSPAP